MPERCIDSASPSSKFSAAATVKHGSRVPSDISNIADAEGLVVAIVDFTLQAKYSLACGEGNRSQGHRSPLVEILCKPGHCVSHKKICGMTCFAGILLAITKIGCVEATPNIIRDHIGCLPDGCEQRECIRGDWKRPFLNKLWPKKLKEMSSYLVMAMVQSILRQRCIFRKYLGSHSVLLGEIALQNPNNNISRLSHDVPQDQ